MIMKLHVGIIKAGSTGIWREAVCFVRWCREREMQHTMKQLSRSLVSIFLAVFVWLPYACAEQADRPSAGIGNTELDQRLEFVEKRLARQSPAARYWQSGWTGFHAASAVVQGILAVDADNNDDEVDYIVGAVKSTGALAQMLIRPLPAVQGSTRFQALPSRSREERIHKLMQGEAQLYENADRAATRSSWKRHLVGVGANLLGGIAIAAFGDSSDAVTSTLLGIAVSETSIWTEPARAVNDLKDYQNDKWMQRESSEVSWHIVPLARRIEVNIRF